MAGLLRLWAGTRRGVAVAEFAVFLVLATWAGAALAAGGAGAAEPGSVEQTLGAVGGCMTKLPPPWPPAWQAEYVDTIRQLVVAHKNAPQYAARLQIIRQGFPSYWETLKKGPERSLFEVQCAEIRWYVESLMADELRSDGEKQKLREQWRGLMDEAAAALVAQFPFLDPNVVQTAKTDYLAKCYRDIEAPLLPTLRHAFSEEQIAQLKERWHSLRYGRVDLWRQLVRSVPVRALPQERLTASLQTGDYLLTQRSLEQLRGQLWAVVAPHPDYYRNALAKQIEARKQQVRLSSEARRQEDRLGRAVWQTEYLSFLFAALLETADMQGNAVAESSVQENAE